MNNQNTLISIIKNQNLNELKTFINSNSDFDFNFTTENGENLLHFSTLILSENTLAIIQILLEKGLDPLAVNSQFVSALEIAKNNNNIPAVTIMKHYANKRFSDLS